MTGDRASITERRNMALELRRAGTSYEAIASLVGVSRTRSWQLVQEGLAAHTAEDVDQLRQLEGQRLDAAQAAIWRAVLDGDTRAIDTFVRISARRARLYGLDLARAEVMVQLEVREAYQDAMTRMMGGLHEMLEGR